MFLECGRPQKCDFISWRLRPVSEAWGLGIAWWWAVAMIRRLGCGIDAECKCLRSAVWTLMSMAMCGCGIAASKAGARRSVRLHLREPCRGAGWAFGDSMRRDMIYDGSLSALATHTTEHCVHSRTALKVVLTKEYKSFRVYAFHSTLCAKHHSLYPCCVAACIALPRGYHQKHQVPNSSSIVAELC